MRILQTKSSGSLSFVPSSIFKLPEEEAKTDHQDLVETKRLPVSRLPVYTNPSGQAECKLPLEMNGGIGPPSFTNNFLIRS